MSQIPMGRIKKIQNDCRQATFLIEKRQQTALTIKEHIHLLIHLAGCGICRLFQRQSRQITRLMRELFRGSAATAHSLDDKFKQDMQEKINRRLHDE